MPSIVVAPTLVAVLLLLAAFFVRYAGEVRVLNFIDYSRVTEKRELHRWAGGRMALMAGGASFLAALAWLYPHVALPLVFGQALVVLAGVVALVSGASKFQNSVRNSAA